VGVAPDTHTQMAWFVVDKHSKCMMGWHCIDSMPLSQFMNILVYWRENVWNLNTSNWKF